MIDICWKSGVELAYDIRKRRVSPVEVVGAYLDRIQKINPLINAIVTLTEDLAMSEAKTAEEKLYSGEELGLLHGVPVIIKDNVFTRGIKTTFGSRLMENFIPEEDSILVERLKAAGAIILGKTNLSEFALLPITDNLVFGPTRNPWNLKKTSGGSSGGSAAAVAAGLSPMATGNDAGGSIRIPASLCGVFGLKPSFGRVPCYPKLNGWGTLLHEGPIARTVADAAMMLQIMAGPDERDLFTLPESNTNYVDSLDIGVKGLKVAYSPDLGYAAVDPEIKAITCKSSHVFKELGCHVEEVNLGLPDMLDALQLLVTAGVITANEEKLIEWGEKIYPALRPIFSKALTINWNDLVKIQFRKEEIWEILRCIFEKYDLLLTPTSAVAAFDVAEGYIGPHVIGGKKVRQLSWIAFTYPFNFTGQPAASVPCGFTSEGLPVGLQIVGKRYNELTVLRASAAFEEARPWKHHRPPETY